MITSQPLSGQIIFTSNIKKKDLGDESVFIETSRQARNFVPIKNVISSLITTYSLYQDSMKATSQNENSYERLHDVSAVVSNYEKVKNKDNSISAHIRKSESLEN